MIVNTFGYGNGMGAWYDIPIVQQSIGAGLQIAKDRYGGTQPGGYRAYDPRTGGLVVDQRLGGDLSGSFNFAPQGTGLNFTTLLLIGGGILLLLMMGRR